MRSRVVFPDPLSPRIVRNSPSATSREISRNTLFLPKVLATFLTLSSVARPVGAVVAIAAVSVAVINKLRAVFRLDRQKPNRRRLLCRFYFVPNLVVLRASRHILPEINPLLISVDVVQVQALHFLPRHQLRGVRIRRSISRHIRHLLLGLRL